LHFLKSCKSAVALMNLMSLPPSFDFLRESARAPAELIRLSNQPRVTTNEHQWGKVP
jgi:hypothetical protein